MEEVTGSGNTLIITARTSTRQARCPGCGTVSAGVHGRYLRRLRDTPLAGQQTILHPKVRRFRCPSTTCGRRTFAEQVEGLTRPFTRKTPNYHHALEKIALSLAGRPGARLARALSSPVSPSSLIRPIKSLPEDPSTPAPRVLGVDDFALKRGHIYASMLVYMETGRRVEVLPDRTAATFAAWLRAHPGVEIVCRDRGGAYAEAVRAEAPGAVQVADRFHVWKNLCEVVEKCVAAHRDCLAEPEPGPPEASGPAVADAPVPSVLEGVRGAKRRERHAAVHALLAKRAGISAIAEALGLDHKTVRDYARAAAPEEMPADSIRARPTRVQPYLAYLHRRWNEGCTDAARLCAEIREQGYRGSQRTVRRHLEPLRGSGGPAPACPKR